MYLTYNNYLNIWYRMNFKITEMEFNILNMLNYGYEIDEPVLKKGDNIHYCQECYKKIDATRVLIVCVLVDIKIRKKQKQK